MLEGFQLTLERTHLPLTELERIRQVLQIIPCCTKPRVSSTAAMDTAREVLQKRILTQEIVDLLIDRVFVYPDGRMEIEWKLSDFVDCMPQEVIVHAAI